MGSEMCIRDRFGVVIDIRKTPSSPVADQSIRVKPGRDFELLWALRTLVRGRDISPDIEEITGVSRETLDELAERMKNCNFGVLFFGMGLTMTRGRHFNSGALLALATDLNKHTHSVTSIRAHCWHLPPT